ncbi:MAG: type VI secretion system tip protein VgrG [Burkholderiales bacterium]|nr:type VI secretion system tip protein VgrG [Burkholderiales bacterium]
MAALKPMVLSTQQGDELLFRRMAASEELGRLFEFEIEAVADNPVLDVLSLLGTPAGVALELPDASLRHFQGLVVEAGAAGAIGHGLYAYRLLLRPALWLLTRRADCRIFQGLSVVEILQQVFERFALEVDFQLGGRYAAREYCVQYRESDFNFASRLMEQEGIYYYFRHEASRHVMVLVDAAGRHAPCAGQAAFRYSSAEHDEDRLDHVAEWGARRSVESGQVVLADYDWRKPASVLRASAGAGDPARPSRLEVYDYAVHYVDAAEGSRYAGLRLQEEGARGRLFNGAGPLRALAVGHRFMLEHHPQADQNAEYLALSTQIEMSSPGCYSDEGETRFDCRFSAIPSGQAFRSARLAERTRIPGPQTARVVGPAGEEIHTDDQGRVKLHFHWDRLGKADENSSCWVRVATPWAGAMRGWFSLPRIGDEVVVDFLEGDPDRPLVTGSVYNASQPPPWELPANKTQSGLLTRSSPGGAGQSNANALRFEDRMGSEQVWLHAERDHLIEVEHDEDHQVGNDRRKNVGHDETTSIGRNRSENVGKDESITVAENRTESVGQNESLSIGGNRSETVGKNESIDIGAKRDETVADDETVAIGKNRSHTVAKNESLSVGGKRSAAVGEDDQLQVGKNLSIRAGDSITLVTGSASLTLKKDGTIQIKGKDITLVGSGKIGIKASGDLVLKGSKIAEN